MTLRERERWTRPDKLKPTQTICLDSQKREDKTQEILPLPSLCLVGKANEPMARFYISNSEQMKV